MKNSILVFVSLIVLVLTFSQCRKDVINTDSSFSLEFSNDTILFDTVFSTIGSTTRVLKLYNNGNDRVIISNVYLEKGTDSEFRMNVDGISGFSHSDIEIDGNDSLYIFLEVTINPNSEFLPFIVEDNVQFLTNGNSQKVVLNAYGRNAIFHGSLDDTYILEGDELLWNNTLPHVVYGMVVVDSSETLTILPGTQVYCHARSGILVYKSTLEVQGQNNNPVVFQGDRLESVYSDEPGQWGIELNFNFDSGFGIDQATVTRGGIWIFKSPGSTIDHAIIKNGVIGVQVDSTGTPGNALTMTNTIVENMSAHGLFSQEGSIYAENSLFANCGQACANLTIGGKYKMYHNTFANYWNFGNRQSPTFYMSNYYIDVNNNTQIRPLYDTEFVDCIMYGDNATQDDFSEFIVDVFPEGAPDFEFRYCLVDTDQSMEEPDFTNIFNGQTPTFEAPEDNNFDIPESITLPLYMIGTSIGSSSDIEDIPYSNNEMGCYSKFE